MGLRGRQRESANVCFHSHPGFYSAPRGGSSSPNSTKGKGVTSACTHHALGAGQIELTNTHTAGESKKSQSGVERPQCEVRSSYTHTVEAVFDSRVGPDRSPTAAAATGEPSYTLNSTAAGAAASARLTFGVWRLTGVTLKAVPLGGFRGTTSITETRVDSVQGEKGPS